MPDIPVGSQIFDLIFHPTHPTVYTGLLDGQVKAFSYDEQGNYDSKFQLKPTKKSCRGLAISPDGSKLWATGKAKALHAIDTTTGVVLESRSSVHDAAVNRIKHLMPNLFSTGDDNGVIKLWDPRKPEAVRTYTHHFDFISDFLFLDDKKQLVSTSGDGTLSVVDVRSKKLEPLTQSEDQEDELLSIVPIKGGQKFVVGTQLGILAIFNRRNGWGDCVDRIPGHPHSVDTLCTLPSRYPSSQSTILTGSSDGLLRVVQLFPTKLLGVVADHGEFPIERIAVDMNGQGRWVGSASHEEHLKLTDLNEVFEDEEKDEDDDGENGESGSDEGEDGGNDEDEGKVEQGAEEKKSASEEDADEEPEENESGGDSDAFVEKKRKKKKEVDPLKAAKRKKGRNEVEAEAAFFADL